MPLGAPELLIIAIIIIVIFGVGKLGDVGKSLGRGIREFREEVKSPTSNEVNSDGVTKVDLLDDSEKQPRV